MSQKCVGRWKGDAESNACEHCGVSFTFFKRRHHCRHCGGIYCDECTSRRHILPNISQTEKQRVCIPCSAGLSAAAIPNAMPAEAPSHNQDRNAATVGQLGDGQERNNGLTRTPQSSPTPRHGRRQSEATSQAGSEALEPPRIDLDQAVEALNGGPQLAPNHSLAFLTVMQESMKHSNADDVVSILLFAGMSKEQTIVIDVGPDETMQGIAKRVAPLYFKLAHSAFRRMGEADLRELLSVLRFHTENSTVPPQTPAREVVSNCKRLILSTLDHSAIVKEMSKGSGQSIRSFLRSEHSERQTDLPAEVFD